MAESAPGSRGPDRSGPEAGGSSSGKAAIPGAAPLRSPRDTQGEGSDGNSETPTSSLTPSEEDEQEEEGHQWRVGDACTTTWAGDGLLYPARLRALDPVAGTCLVEFDGYGNTEERALAELLPPRPGAWGMSDTPRGEGPPRAEPRQPSTPSSWELPPGVRRKKASLHTTQEEEEEEDTLAAMLMAWYMSGYHTGFYVGLREGRAEAAEPLPRPGHRQKKPPRS